MPEQKSKVKVAREGKLTFKDFKSTEDVKNKDPNKHYSFVRTDEPKQQLLAARLNYTPARGKEQIMPDPLTENFSCKDGEVKKRGNRILMCCPKKEYEARKKEQYLERQRRKHTGKERAAKLQRQAGKGVTVKDLSENS